MMKDARLMCMRGDRTEQNVMYGEEMKLVRMWRHQQYKVNP